MSKTFEVVFVLSRVLVERPPKVLSNLKLFFDTSELQDCLQQKKENCKKAGPMPWHFSSEKINLTFCMYLVLHFYFD